MDMNKFALITAIVASAGLLLAGSAVAQQKMYRWVDENGQVHYGDRVPPQYAKQRRDVLNEYGQTVETKPRELTAEERAAQQQASTPNELELEQQKQDRYLLSTYPTLRDLQSTHDNRLGNLDANIGINEESRANTAKSLQQLRQRAVRIEQAGGKVDPDLQVQIAEFEQRLAESEEALQGLRAEREALKAEFAVEVERYKSLKAGGDGEASQEELTINPAAP